MYKNLKEYITLLEREGELLRISVPVDPLYEIAEITDRVSKSPGGGKALLFESVGGDFPVATNLFGSDRRIALALGVESLDAVSQRIASLIGEVTTPKNSLMDKLRMLPMLAEMSRWLPRIWSSQGECQQVVLKEAEASLALLPILKCWPHDGGRFVTLPMVHTVDPDTGVRNVGMYRMQIFDNHTTGMHWHIHKTGARHYDGYKRLGQRMPVSVALGGDPVYTYAATAPMPDNMDEYLLAGFLRQRPVKLVKCITNDLYVPADCDFVIEGYVDPSEEKCVEGPFGDHTGFYSLEDKYPRFHVTAITHRREAVYPATLVGVPPQEDAYIAKATERIFLEPIRLVVQPEVRDLTMPTAGTAHNVAIVSIDCRYQGQSTKVAQGLWGAGQMMFNKYLLVVPASVNVRDASALAPLVRNASLDRSLIRSEGVLDVLDHATATCGFGGKLALDLTVNESMAVESVVAEPHNQVAANGLNSNDATSAVRFNYEFFKQWGIVAAFADQDIDVPMPCEAKYFVIFDSTAHGLSGEELLWLAAANTDPRRDVRRESKGLTIDARSKSSSKAEHPKRFPNVVVSSQETIMLVDGRWCEYELGTMIESPSRRYQDLMLSDQAQW